MHVIKKQTILNLKHNVLLEKLKVLYFEKNYGKDNFLTWKGIIISFKKNNKDTLNKCLCSLKSHNQQFYNNKRLQQTKDRECWSCNLNFGGSKWIPPDAESTNSIEESQKRLIYSE